MEILGIETSGTTFSIALHDNRTLVSEIFWHSGLRHSERLVPTLDHLMREAQVDVRQIEKIVVSTGPGSFTGIRVGLTCARVLAQGLGIPLVGIDTLELLEAGVPSCGCRIVSAIDALRDEVYVKEGSQVAIKPVDLFCRNLKKRSSNVLIVGNAAIAYRRRIKEILGNKVVFPPDHLNFPRAGVLCALAEKKKGQTYADVSPLYVRRSWAEEKKP
jgi:tRNA threonylcarbamoyladenosine biosynthesis protein TsaB